MEKKEGKKFVGAGWALVLFFLMSAFAAMPSPWEKQAVVYVTCAVMCLSLIGAGGYFVQQTAKKMPLGSFWGMAAVCGLVYVLAAILVFVFWSGGRALESWMLLVRFNSVASVLYSGLGLAFVLRLAFTSR